MVYTAKAAITGRGWGDQAQLYIYNGNLLQFSTYTSSEVSPAARISAGGGLLSACENGKSAGRKSFGQRIEEVLQWQIEKACYNISTVDTFHGPLVTSKPTLLQIMLYAPRNHISLLVVLPCRTSLRRRSTETRLR